MDSSAVRQALNEVGLAGGRLRQIHGGWAYWTFDLDDRWIVRFPRTDEIASAAAREIALLPALAPRLSFAVPEPSHVGTANGRPFFAYPKIDGRGLSPTDGTQGLLTSVGSMLAELHSVDIAVVAERLGIADPTSAWFDRYAAIRREMIHVAVPVMPSDLAEEVVAAFDRCMEQFGDVHHVLAHHDLGLEHLLVADDGQPVGLIDFEDAWLGDPAIDLVPLLAAFGTDQLSALTAGRDLGPQLGERLWFYRWMGSVHAISYGVTEGVETERVDGLAELRRRLDRPVLEV